MHPALLAGSSHGESEFARANLNAADVRNAVCPQSISVTRICGRRILRQQLPGGVVRGATLDDADFSGADLSNADFSGATLAKRRFT